MSVASFKAPSSELRTISVQAGTVLVGQLAVMGYAVADSIFAGRYAAEALAAFSVGTAIYASVYVALMGVMQALMPIYAEYHGAKNPLAVGAAWRQSLYLTGAMVVLGTVFLFFPQPVLRVAQVPPALVPIVTEYLQVQAMAVLPALLFRNFSTLSQAIGQPKIVTWIQIASLPTKVALSYWFVFGGLGVSSMGAVGCAWATLITSFIMLFSAFWLLKTQPAYRALHALARFEGPNLKRLSEFARLGIPGGLSMLFEVSSFTLMAVLAARLGTVASAAHQIAATCAAVLYMTPLSISIATSARVSFWIGAGDAGRAGQAIRLGFKLAIGYAAMSSALLITLSTPIAGFISADQAVIALASGLLVWVAAYQFSDAVQTLCVFILRCYRVTVAPFVVYVVILWGLGLGGGMVLTYQGFLHWPALNSPIGFWIAGAGALTLTAGIFCIILWATVRLPRSSAPAVVN